MTNSDFEVVETLPLRKGRSTAVLGFGGPGFIGSAAIMHIVRSKGFRQRAFIRSRLMPPMMLIVDGQPTQAFRIYSNDDDSVLFVTSESVLVHENAWPVGTKLMEWLLSKGAEAFISIEGLPFGVPSRERVILGFSTDRDLAQLGVQPAREGAISGMNATMVEECLKRRMSWTTLFVPTYVMTAIDFGGGAAIIEVLNRIFKLGVDVTPLKERDEMVRRATGVQTRQKGAGFLGRLKGT